MLCTAKGRRKFKDSVFFCDNIMSNKKGSWQSTERWNRWNFNTFVLFKSITNENWVSAAENGGLFFYYYFRKISVTIFNRIY